MIEQKEHQVRRGGGKATGVGGRGAPGEVHHPSDAEPFTGSGPIVRHSRQNALCPSHLAASCLTLLNCPQPFSFSSYVFFQPLWAHVQGSLSGGLCSEQLQLRAAVLMD